MIRRIVNHCVKQFWNRQRVGKCLAVHSNRKNSDQSAYVLSEYFLSHITFIYSGKAKKWSVSAAPQTVFAIIVCTWLKVTFHAKK